MTPEEAEVVAAARFVLNCMADGDTVWDHMGGGCLTDLKEAVEALDEAHARMSV